MKKKVYFVDEIGIKRELGPSMMCFAGESICTFCPICRACLNQYYDKEKDELCCKVYGKSPKELISGDSMRCMEYLPNISYYNYPLVKKSMEEWEKEQNKCYHSRLI